MNRTLMSLLGLALCSPPALAVICKTVDADGVVSYSEVPASECPEVVKLPEYSSYTPRPLPPTIRDERSEEPPVAAEGFSGYSKIAIVAPEQDGTVRDNEGKVMVTIALEPPLQDDHQVRLFIDGQQVPGNFEATTVELSGVERGTHQLAAEVVDARGSMMLRSDDVSFTLRRVGLLDGAGGRGPGIPTPRPR
jgi:hypothetical protein